MKELKNVTRDILNGSLPLAEVLGFLASLFRKAAWTCIVVVFAFVIGYWLGK